MSRVSTTRGYKGRGRFTLRPLAGGRPFELGNVVSLSETIESDRTSRQNYQDVGGGELDVVETITSVAFEMTANDITPQNIAIGMRGSFEALGSLAITDEAGVVWQGTRTAFRNLPDPVVAVVLEITGGTRANTTAYALGDTIIDTGRGYVATVGGISAGTAPTYPTNLSTVTDGTVTWKDVGPVALVADVDYARTPHGVIMLAASNGRFSPDLPIPVEISYTRNPQFLVQALVDAGQEYEMIYHGLNEVDSGNPLTGRYFRVKFSPTSGFNRQGGDDFSELTLTGTVLQDESRIGAGLSKFMEFSMI